LEAHMQIIDKALSEGRSVLSEYESKQVLAHYGVPVTTEMLIKNEQELTEAIERIHFPIVLKGCSPELSHKTEKNLVILDVRTREAALEAFREISAKLGPGDAVLVQEMVKGARELVAGMTRDAQFGPCVMFGLGGVFTEALKDVCFRMAPLSSRDAFEMMEDIRGHKILGPVRGMPEANREELADVLVTVGRIGLENSRIKEIDINPLILRDGRPVAVDALIVLG
jgi:acetate---CoA ligase (ADP-forming) subunit beta